MWRAGSGAASLKGASNRPSPAFTSKPNHCWPFSSCRSMSRPDRFAILIVAMTGSWAMYWRRLNFSSTWTWACALAVARSDAASNIRKTVIGAKSNACRGARKEWCVKSESMAPQPRKKSAFFWRLRRRARFGFWEVYWHARLFLLVSHHCLDEGLVPWGRDRLGSPYRRIVSELDIAPPRDVEESFGTARHCALRVNDPAIAQKHDAALRLPNHLNGAAAFAQATHLEHVENVEQVRRVWFDPRGELDR